MTTIKPAPRTWAALTSECQAYMLTYYSDQLESKMHMLGIQTFCHRELWAVHMTPMAVHKVLKIMYRDEYLSPWDFEQWAKHVGRREILIAEIINGC